LQAYSLSNIINDLIKKKNKSLLLLGIDGVMLKYLESVLYFAF